MKKIKSPHDRFFRAAMAEQRVAQAFFKQHLPQAILEKVDMASLQLRKDSFIDTQLLETASDMLFSVNINGMQGYFYCLVEHQRKPEPLMAFRFMGYIVQIMAQHLKENEREELPIVYPILFFNGDTLYPYSPDLFDLFGQSKELAKNLLFQPFQLIDLTQIPDATLKQEAWLSILEIFMKHAFARDIMPHLTGLLEALQAVEQEGGRNYIEAAFVYLFSTSKASDPQAFINAVKDHLSLETEKRIMTLAQQFEARGEARGMKRLLEKQRAIALKLIEQGMSAEQAACITELPLATIKELYETSGHECSF